MCSSRPTDFRSYFSLLILVIGLAGAGCGGSVVQVTVAEASKGKTADPINPVDITTWLGNSTRNFYGSGPWPDRPLRVIWEFETKLTSGRLHKDGWGGPVGPDNLQSEATVSTSARPTVISIASMLMMVTLSGPTKPKIA